MIAIISFVLLCSGAAALGAGESIAGIGLLMAAGFALAIEE